MNRIFAAAAVIAMGSVGAQGADLIVDEPVVVAPAPEATNIYVQLLGGATAGIDFSFFDGSDEYVNATDIGWAVAGTVGVVVFDGLSVELDGLYTHRNLSDYDDSEIASASIMGNLKYTADLNDMFSIYGAVGLGYIRYYDRFEGEDGEFSGFGYQFIGGIGAEISEGVSLIGEARYQNTFDNAVYDESDDLSLQVPTVTVLGGVKLSF